MNVEEILDVVRRDTVFYRSSNGGVTISGGEPLDQSKFTYELVKSLKTEDYHVALDTSGYADFGVLQKLMPYVDLFLYDVKHVKSKPHQAFTGVDNKKILKNLNRLSKLGCKIWVRIPLIPMFNDSEVDLHDLAYKLADMKIKQICILPYHGYASWKYEKLNQSYDLSGTGRPSDEKLAQAKKIMEDYGMKVKIGG